MREIKEGVWLLDAGRAIVTTNSNAAGPKINGDLGKINTITYGKDRTRTAKIMYWGARNLLPQERELLIKSNNIIPELLGTKRDLMLGGGIYCYRERITEKGDKQIILKDPIPTPPEIQNFFDRNNIPQYLRRAAKSLTVHSNVFTEFTSLAGGAVDRIKAHDARQVRMEEQDMEGMVNNYYVCGKWSKLSEKDAVVSKVPAYDEDSEFQAQYMLHTGDDMFTDDYYYSPRWWGGKDWITLANRVPIFHLSNLTNGYLIRWHIEIPKDYFRDYTSAAQTPEDMKESGKREDEARRRFLRKLNQFLAGEENAGRAVVTNYELDKKLGKEFPGIKITALNVDLKDTALLDVFEKSNDANISGQGIPPALASIQTSRPLGSGSETRNAFNVYMITKTPVPRDILLEPLYLVARKNGWDPTIRLGFRDMELTTLDDSKTGQKEAVA